MTRGRKRICGLFFITLAIYAAGALYVHSGHLLALPSLNAQRAPQAHPNGSQEDINAWVKGGVPAYIFPEQPGDYSSRMIFMLENIGSLGKENYLVVIAASDEASHLFDENVAACFKALGLNEGPGGWRLAYVGILYRGQAVFERPGDDVYDVVAHEAYFDGLHVFASSAGYEAIIAQTGFTSIMINGLEYALRHRGLNIVVFDLDMDAVVDSVSFDTLDDLLFRQAILDRWDGGMER